MSILNKTRTKKADPNLNGLEERSLNTNGVRN